MDKTTKREEEEEEDLRRITRRGFSLRRMRERHVALSFLITVKNDSCRPRHLQVSKRQNKLNNHNSNKIIVNRVKTIASRLRHVSRSGSFFLTYLIVPRIVDMPLTLINRQEIVRLIKHMP